MKNLPEKIYLNFNMTPQEVVETKDKDFHVTTKTWEITWSKEMLSEHDPEYVRKDSFIDKVSDWLDKNLYDFYDGEDEFGKCGQGRTAHEFIKDFKNYMEE